MCLGLLTFDDSHTDKAHRSLALNRNVNPISGANLLIAALLRLSA